LIHQSGSPSASHMHAWPLKLLRLASATSAAVCVGTRIHGPAGRRRSAVAAVVGRCSRCSRTAASTADGGWGSGSDSTPQPQPASWSSTWLDMARHGSTWLDMAWTRLRSAPRSLPTRGCQASGPVACGSAAHWPTPPRHPTPPQVRAQIDPAHAVAAREPPAPLPILQPQDRTDHLTRQPALAQKKGPSAAFVALNSSPCPADANPACSPGPTATKPIYVHLRQPC
jgi:hypothetical protein